MRFLLSSWFYVLVLAGLTLVVTPTVYADETCGGEMAIQVNAVEVALQAMLAKAPEPGKFKVTVNMDENGVPFQHRITYEVNNKVIFKKNINRTSLGEPSANFDIKPVAQDRALYFVVNSGGNNPSMNCYYVFVPEASTIRKISLNKQFNWVYTEDLDKDGDPEIITAKSPDWIDSCDGRLCGACTPYGFQIMHVDMSTGQLRDDSFQYPDFYANQANALKDTFKDLQKSPTEVTGGLSGPLPPACTKGFEDLISRTETLGTRNAGTTSALTETTLQNTPKKITARIVATALGIKDDGKILNLAVPKGVGIEVTFTALLTGESNKTSNYLYHWFIDGKEQSAKGAQLPPQWLSPAPKDKPYSHNIVLDVEEFGTAQSTPPAVYSVAIPTTDASIQVLLTQQPTWDCKGRLGSECNDSENIDKTLTTGVEVVPWGNVIGKDVDGVEVRCDDLGKGQICIKSKMSVGAILHDRCCVSHPYGHWCDGLKSGSNANTDCANEWDHAEKDKLEGFLFEHIWKYSLDGTNEPASKGIENVWWRGLARTGTVVSRGREVPSADEVQAICQSTKAEPKEIPLNISASSDSPGAPPVTGILWVCSDKGGLSYSQSSVAEKLQLGSKGPGGGIVFYVDNSGLHGLEAKAKDEANGNGLEWTAAIAAASAYGSGWHLPTKDELDQLYNQKNLVGGFDIVGYEYWSSSEYNRNYAWSQDFFRGLQNYPPKDSEYHVRAVRAF